MAALAMRLMQRTGCGRSGLARWWHPCSWCLLPARQRCL